jgi:hypothetical protein
MAIDEQTKAAMNALRVCTEDDCNRKDGAHPHAPHDGLESATVGEVTESVFGGVMEMMHWALHVVRGETH